MSILKKLLYFIGGKPPQIIYKNGEVTHVHGDKKWQQWKDRFEKNPEYRWKEHSGFSPRHKN
jgi:hypothetical protein